MRIRNETDRPVVVAMRWRKQPGVDVDRPGWDDRVELLQPGQESDDYMYHADELGMTDVITIEEVG